MAPLPIQDLYHRKYITITDISTIIRITYFCKQYITIFSLYQYTSRMIQNDLVFRGDQIYSDIFTHIGKVQLINGRRIISNQTQDKTWIAVCFTSKYGEIFVCEETNHKKDELSGWFQTWKGKKYTNFCLNYYGEFSVFMKHTEKQEGFQYINDKSSKQVYKGSFKYDQRHTNPNQKGMIQIQNINNLQKNQGVWENGNKQGQFLCYMITNKQKRVFKQTIKKYYYNDTQVPQGTLFRNPSTSEKDLNDRFNVGLTLDGVKSLEPGKCLYSEVLDFFFKHLCVSFNHQQSKIRNMKAFTVYMFQKLISSGKISQQRGPKAQINYHQLKSMGEVYKNVTSIFQVNPLILFPLNRDKSHFALGAIATEVFHQKQQLTKVNFTIFYLDPLHNTEMCVPLILKEYISSEIKQNVLKQQRKVYETGLANAVIDFKTNQFTGQTNDVDCGVFACIYGLLLTIDLCLKDKYVVNWKWSQQKLGMVNWFREKLIYDAQIGVHNFLDVLVKKLISENILEKRNKGQ